MKTRYEIISHIEEHMFPRRGQRDDFEFWVTALRSHTWKSVLDYFERLDVTYWRATKNSTRIAIRGETESCPATAIAPGFGYSRLAALMYDDLPAGRNVVVPDTALSLLTKCFSGKGDIWLSYARFFAGCFYFVDRNDPETNNLYRCGPRAPLDILIVIRRMIAKGRTTQKSRFSMQDEDTLANTSQEPTLRLIDKEIEKLLVSGQISSFQHGNLKVEEVPDVFCSC